MRSWGASAAQLDKILEKIRSGKNRALFPDGACDGTENSVCAPARKMNGKKAEGNGGMMRQQRGKQHTGARVGKIKREKGNRKKQVDS